MFSFLLKLGYLRLWFFWKWISSLWLHSTFNLIFRIKLAVHQEQLVILNFKSENDDIFHIIDQIKV